MALLKRSIHARQDSAVGFQPPTEHGRQLLDDCLQADQQAIPFDLFSSPRSLRSESMILATRSRFLRTCGLFGRCVFFACLLRHRRSVTRTSSCDNSNARYCVNESMFQSMRKALFASVCRPARAKSIMRSINEHGRTHPRRSRKDCNVMRHITQQ
jgi:hypothetical protein